MCTTLRGVQVLDSMSVVGELVDNMTQEVKESWPSMSTAEASPESKEAAAHFMNASIKHKQLLKEKVTLLKDLQTRITNIETGVDKLRDLTKAVSEAPCKDSEEGLNAVLALEAFVKSTTLTSDVKPIMGKLDSVLVDIKVLMEASSLHRFMFSVPTCPICMQDQCKQMLPCGHTFCHVCVDDISRQSSGSRRQRELVVTCPMCRNTSSLNSVRNIFIDC